jgi:hypothetical protein
MTKDSGTEVLFVKNLQFQGLGLTLDFWGRIEQDSLIRNVQFYPRNPGLKLDPESSNSYRIAPQGGTKFACT